MKIRMLTSIAGADFALSRRDETDRFSDDECARLIAAGFAVAVEGSKPDAIVTMPEAADVAPAADAAETLAPDVAPTTGDVAANEGADAVAVIAAPEAADVAPAVEGGAEAAVPEVVAKPAKGKAKAATA